MLPADGVVTGTGYVGGRVVAAFSQDFTVVGGSLGKMHAKKIVTLMQQAAKLGCPIVAFKDSAGARIQEGVDALSGYGDVFYMNVLAVRRRAADRGGLRPLRGRRGLFAGADGLRRHDPEERLHVHHRAGGDQGGDRQGGDDGRGRQRRHARLGLRQRPFPRRGRRRRGRASSTSFSPICLRTIRRIRRTGRTPTSSIAEDEAVQRAHPRRSADADGRARHHRAHRRSRRVPRSAPVVRART